ncbi:nuclear transport factor 2 family protein [Rhodococcus phenolicus]|uniref:nuclear transport factor 2 family protein n=1 Tax=Rhodococcus phenolicus TaxID=263849 RepID=UPI003CCB7F50
MFPEYHPPSRKAAFLPTRDEICSVVESYVKHLGDHDVDRLVSLFADDAVQHEPLGVRTYRGVDEIRAFDVENAKVAFSVSRHSPIVVSGRYAATQLRVQREGMPAFLAADLFEFDDDGRIVALSVVIDPAARA